TVELPLRAQAAPLEQTPVGPLRADPAQSSTSARRPAPEPQPCLSPQRLRRSLELLVRIALVLRDIHRLGLIHGDLSPANILLRDSGDPVLIDFGTSLPIFDAGLSRETPFAWGQTRGTPGYAAPEVLSGDFLDWRCDVYALGCIAYELLTGCRPFRASTVQDLVKQHLSAPLPPPGEVCPALPRELQLLLVHMLEKDPLRRTPQLDSIVEQLGSALGEPARADGDRSTLVFFRPQLEGRVAALAALEHSLRELKAQRGGLALLTGPSGIGKTRLLNEAAMLAARSGVAVITCRGTETPGSSSSSAPAGAVLDLLGPVFQAAAGRSQRDERMESPAELFTLPQIKAILQAYAPSPWLEAYRAETLPRLNAQASVQRVFDALFSLLQRMASETPLLLVVDDLQAADALSRQFLCSHAGKLAASNVLVLGAIRSDASESVLQPLLKAAQQRLEVEALDAAAIVAIGKALLGAEHLPEGLDDYVVRHAEGNPLFAAEYLRLAVDRGWLRWQRSFEWQPPNRHALEQGAADIPASIDELVSSRLAQLPARAREVVRIAAIVGREFDEAALGALCPAPDLAGSLRHLVLAQVLEELPSQAYRFKYDKLRELAARELLPAERRRLHRSLAESLERNCSLRAVQGSSRLGHHWAEAGCPERALEHLTAAAGEACGEHALDAACDLYRGAIQQREILAPGASSTSLAELLERLGDVLLTRARHSEARDCYERAARQQPEGLGPARLQRKGASSLWTLHDYDGANAALTLAEQQLLLLTDASEDYQREVIEVKLGRFEHLYFAQRQGPGIEALLDELAPLVERWGSASQRNTFYLAAASQRQLAARYAFDERAVQLARRAFEASAELTQDRQAVARFLYAFALVFGSSSQREEALPHLMQAAGEAIQTQSTTLLSRVRTHHAIATLRLGRVQETRGVAELALRAAEDARLSPYVAAACACLGWVHWRSGSLAEARKQLGRARHTWLSHPHPFPLRWVAGFPLLALAHAEDDVATVLELLRDLTHPSQQLLPERLLQGIAAALDSCSQDVARAASDAITRVLHIAREEHFA
ncbi:MAG: AAA family ATPase, partial [Deltaproteobacteria bacterium]